MVEAQIIGLHGGSHGRLWIRFTHGTGLSSHHHEDDFTISRKDQETMLRLVTRMERYAGRCSKARSLRNKTQLRKINAKANALLQTGGKRIFKILRNGVTTVDVKSLDDLFEGNAPLTLIVDEKTRTFPWELAYDGNKFLFEYMIGRKIQDPPNASFDAGLEPQHKAALVVGLNYKKHKLKEKDGSPISVNVLNYAPREALSVYKLLHNELKYDVVLLRNEDATVENVRELLSNGVSIFHFTGHGMFESLKQGADQESALLLYDGFLTRNDLRKCFEAAGGAPYLSFLNACLSAKEACNKRLADAFVDCGAEYVIGTLWTVYDPPATWIARKFYQQAINNVSLAKALLIARKQFMNKKSLAAVTTWPSFIFYGSPAYALTKAPKTIS